MDPELSTADDVKVSVGAVFVDDRFAGLNILAAAEPDNSCSQFLWYGYIH